MLASPHLKSPPDLGPLLVMRSYPQAPSSRIRSGFTLIELLTVIAIIGILAAILIPTVGKVRNSAKKAQCVSMMRQWGAAVNLCANDYKSHIALFFRSDPFSYAPYLDNARSMNVTSSTGVVSNRSTIDAMSVCPTGINGDNSLSSVKQYAFVVPVGVTARNAKLFGVFTDQYYYRISDASAPAKLLLMVEVANQINVVPGTLGGIQTAINGANSIRKMQSTRDFIRHGGIAHGLFLDGHIGALSTSDTDYSLSKEKLDTYFSLR